MVLFGLLLYLKGQSQEPQNYGPVPNSTGDKYSVNNNLYDGSANVIIPILSNKVDGVPVNVCLGYNTKGIKVDQVASSVGLGWSVLSGPSIQRVLHDFPDEVLISKLYIRVSATSHITSQASVGSWYNPAPLPTTIDQTTYFNLAHNDYELDEFQVSLNGKNFSFYISKTGNVTTVPKTNVRIERVINGTIIGQTALTDPTNNTSITLAQQWDLGFIITDDAGNKYTFIKGNAHRLKYPQLIDGMVAGGGFAGSDDYEIIDSWVIKKAETSYGKTVLYDYTVKNVEYDLSASELLIEPDGTASPSINMTINSSKGYISYLKKIEINKANYVDFFYESRKDLPNTQALTKITITNDHAGYSGTQLLVKNSRKTNFNLSYAYFHTPDDQTINTELPFNTVFSGSDKNIRLKLKSVRSDFGGGSELLNEFEYETTPLPSRLSIVQDLYGYYNGASPKSPSTHPNLKTSIAEHQFYGTNEFLGISKFADPEYGKAWSLKKVKNGSGAEIEFLYEGHSGLSIPAALNVPQIVATRATGDGIRLAAKIERDKYLPDNDVLTEYIYSGGEMFLPGGRIVRRFSLRASDGTDFHFDIYSNTFTTANMSINGSNHGYSKVVERQKKKYRTGPNAGQFGEIIGSKENEFTNATLNLSGYTNVSTNLLNPSNINSDPSNSFNVRYYDMPFTNRQYYRWWAMGLPVKIRTLDHSGKVSAVSISKYSFTDEYVSSADFRSAKHEVYHEWETHQVIGVNSDIYYLNTGVQQLTQTEEQKYLSDNVFSSKIVNNYYDSYNNVTKAVSTTSDGRQFEVRNYYSYNWLNNPTQGDAIAWYINNGYHGLILSETWLLGTTPALNTILNTGFYGSIVVDNKILPAYKYTLLTKNGLSQSIYGTGGPQSIHMYNAAHGMPLSSFKLQHSILNYDSYRNAREIKGLADDYVSTFYNGLEGDVIANVKNARLMECAYTSFDGTYGGYGANDDNKGNWDFNPDFIKSTTDEQIAKISGTLIYKLQHGSANVAIYSKNIAFQNGKTYILSFWAKNGSPVIKHGSAIINATAVKSAYGGWMLYRAIFTANSGTLTIEPDATGTAYIDELRLYPKGALMNTITYEPLFGVSAKCDESDNIILYDFDDRGRRNLVRDETGRIISRTKFVTQGSDN